jgi:hypothetical protein
VTTDKPMLPVPATPVKPRLASPTTVTLPAVLVAETLCITKRVSAVVEKGLVENGDIPKIIYSAVYPFPATIAALAAVILSSVQ